MLYLPIPTAFLMDTSFLRTFTIITVYAMNALGAPLQQSPDYYAPVELNNENLLASNAADLVLDNLPIQENADIFNGPVDTSYIQSTIDDYNVMPTLNDNQLNLLTLYLTQVLTDSRRDNDIPLIYIEDVTAPSMSNVAAGHPRMVSPSNGEHLQHNGQLFEDSFVGNTAKRTRYYRKYPWKRQNSRSRMYNAENKYMCQPSREDVYQLLLALHESRSGNRNRTVNFCNRRRPAAAIYTNIRFLGRRRK